MRSAWNPIRRNKHVGTRTHGHSSDNKFVIPESGRERKRFYEYLDSCVRVIRSVAFRDLPFFVELARAGCLYPCTIDDICTDLAHCPPEDVSPFDFLVLRQPTRKQRILNPVWRRALFSCRVSSCTGPAIVMEAQDTRAIIWSASLSSEHRREFDRLRADGQGIRRTRRGIEIYPTPESLRNTMLYRTLLHEIGTMLMTSAGPKANGAAAPTLSRRMMCIGTRGRPCKH